MRVRQALGQGGLVALLLAASCCWGGSAKPSPVDVDPSLSPEELRRRLDEIALRRDFEAETARARIYERLARRGDPAQVEMRARGDAADIGVLSQPAPQANRAESAARLSRHFRDRAATAALRRSSFKGPIAEPLLRFIYLDLSVRFGECASRAEHAAALDGLADSASELAGLEALKPATRARWHLRATIYKVRADDVRGDDRPFEPAPEARRFCESDLARHLEEGTRSAVDGTREAAARGDESKTLDFYLEALVRYVLARECLLDATPAQASALAVADVVLQSVSDMLCREP